ncbi:substrate-binding periplasmic protein [Dongshaea marina]|uniref:substrate-binding periplasmic protein n=1 Tax=Dongshaea marina TaxID=2047966 RepID=UPI000D3E02C7|nr:transporter substrate-binding domain-containing protein [Dongshaea marina]
MFTKLIQSCLLIGFIGLIGITNLQNKAIAAPYPESKTLVIGIEEGSDWPPYEYYKRQGGEVTDEVAGFNVELLHAILDPLGIRFEFRSCPWKRCLALLNQGDEIQMILPTSLNSERKANYLHSRAVYSITPSYFYLKERYPAGLDIQHPSDLLKLKHLCGRFGYNYANFGLDNEQVIRKAKNYQKLTDKLMMGRCDAILARYEVFAAHKLLGMPYLTPEIAHAAIPGVPKEKFYFLLTRHSPYSAELLGIINRGLERLHKEDKLQKMLAHYLKENGL